MVTLTHCTLQTGHRRASPRGEVAKSVLSVLAPLVRRMRRGETVGLPAPPGHRMRIVRQGDSTAVIHLLDDRGPILVTAVAAVDGPEATELWRWSQAPGEAPAAPWCLDRLTHTVRERETYGWTGDFSRCVAWAWIMDWRRRQR